VCETPGCVAHIKRTGSISGSVCGETYLAKWSNPFPQDHKGRQFELCPPRILPGAGGLPRILPGAGAEGQHPTVGRSKARMGVRLLGRAMRGQTVVTAIIYGFVGTE